MADQLQPAARPWQFKVFWLFSLLGGMLIMLSFLIGLFLLAQTAMAYWGLNAKAVRDAAAAGSELLNQLTVLQATPRWLEPLTFLGVASFMVGIALEFSSIPRILRNRGQVMAAAFSQLVKHES